MWTSRDNSRAIDRSGAYRYCGNLSLGGYGDWRLPTIGELSQLYDRGAPADDCTFIPQFPYTCYIRLGIDLSGDEMWSTTYYEPNREYSKTFSFASGRQDDTFHMSNTGNRALCVRGR